MSDDMPKRGNETCVPHMMMVHMRIFSMYYGKRTLCVFHGKVTYSLFSIDLLNENSSLKSQDQKGNGIISCKMGFWILESKSCFGVWLP